MADQNFAEAPSLYFARETTQSKVFSVLSDRQWHCRGHEYASINSGQLAGGGGIQGLQRGTNCRPGLDLISERRFCATCNKKTKWDQWTGQLREANPVSNISKSMAGRILSTLGFRDSIEQRVRVAHELVIDHRFPMERWGAAEDPLPENPSDEFIRNKFQLLKKDSSGNHNLLKSRACEACMSSGQRGTPLGINHFYEGGPSWPEGIPERGPEAERGCVGCGWYDFDRWRESVNKNLKSKRT